MARVVVWMPEHLTGVALPLLADLLPAASLTPLAPDADRDAIVAALAGAEYLIVSGVAIGKEVLAGAPNLRLIQKWGAGVDGIDLAAAARAGVAVANVPGGNAAAVAEHVLALLLTLYKRLLPAITSMREGRWEQAELLSQGLFEIGGKTLGLVGFGHIGRAIATRARAFDMSVIYYKRNPLAPAEERALGVSFRPLPQLLAQADVICVAASLTPEMTGLFTTERFQGMKRSSVFINVSRGAAVNETDLYHALTHGTIAGAALDVFAAEPPTFPPLLQLPNCIATPHIAGRTREAMRAITERCARNVLRVADGQPPQHTADTGSVATG
jgi:phosphoglycerate dehydrogenase-like enzyme